MVSVFIGTLVLARTSSSESSLSFLTLLIGTITHADVRAQSMEIHFTVKHADFMALSTHEAATL